MSANLSGAHLAASFLESCLLTGANLSGAEVGRIDGGELSNINISGANLRNAVIEGIETSGGVVGVPASGPTSWGTLIGPFLFGLGSTFYNADLSGLDFSGVDMSQSAIYGSNVTGTRFANAKLGDDNQTQGLETRALVGTPANLPTGWRMIRGYLLGPFAQIANGTFAMTASGWFQQTSERPAANFAGLNLAGADLRGTQWGTQDFYFKPKPYCAQVDPPSSIRKRLVVCLTSPIPIFPTRTCPGRGSCGRGYFELTCGARILQAPPSIPHTSKVLICAMRT